MCQYFRRLLLHLLTGPGAVLSEKEEDNNIVISNKAVLPAEPHTPEQHKTTTLKKLLPNKKAKGGPKKQGINNFQS